MWAALQVKLYKTGSHPKNFKQENLLTSGAAGAGRECNLADESSVLNVSNVSSAHLN